MTTSYYTCGNIVRILAIDGEDPANSRMTDIDMDRGTVLGVFDAARPFDAAFIRSFLNILSESSAGFTPTEDPAVTGKASSILTRCQAAGGRDGIREMSA